MNDYVQRPSTSNQIIVILFRTHVTNKEERKRKVLNE